mmetsp:Transcript_127930/g.239289  ORF Transcript_127930/g.239289 Transcript_127930/m.239289 type:complete len:726 (+) Transcript_127930:124-2301(+)
MGCGAGAKQKYSDTKVVEVKAEQAPKKHEPPKSEPSAAKKQEPVKKKESVKKKAPEPLHAEKDKSGGEEPAKKVETPKKKKPPGTPKGGITSTGEPVLPLRLGPPLAVEEDDDDSPPEFLHVICPEKKSLEDYYEICAPEHWKNNRPVWFDGQNHIYSTTTKAWSIAVDQNSIDKDRGWVYDSAYGSDRKWPQDGRSWQFYNGKEWKSSKAKIEETPPPHVNVECAKRPDLNGNYTLMTFDDPDFPIWGHGHKRLYKDDIACRWAVCLQEDTMEQRGGMLCSSTKEPIRDRPDKVEAWVCHDGTGWVDTEASVSITTRPPPLRLEVKCPEKPDIDGMYKLKRKLFNDRHTWADGDHHVYMTKGNAWAVCIGEESMKGDRGWLYAKLREAKFPDKVEEWHSYNNDTKEWSKSDRSHVRIPASDKRSPVLAEVYKGPALWKAKKKVKPKPEVKAKDQVEMKQKAAPKEKKLKDTAKKKVVGRMKDIEEATGGGKSNITILPNTNWMDIVPRKSCLEELQGMAKVLPRVDDIADDVEMKAQELKFSLKDHPVKLSEDSLCAIVAYTHDLNNQDGSPDGNVYYELNRALRQRGQDARKDMMEQWGYLVHFLIKGLAQLPDWKGECYRGFRGKEEVLKEYEIGRPIQWGAFTSVTTSWESASSFTDEEDGVIFRIMVTNGRQISDFSFFPSEDEVLLTPAHRFTVTSDPYEVEGFTVIDMVQQKNKVFVS